MNCYKDYEGDLWCYKEDYSKVKIYFATNDGYDTDYDWDYSNYRDFKKNFDMWEFKLISENDFILELL